jgi:hypothetical protein
MRKLLTVRLRDESREMADSREQSREQNAFIVTVAGRKPDSDQRVLDSLGVNRVESIGDLIPDERQERRQLLPVMMAWNR